MFKKIRTSFLAFLLVFSMITSTVFGASNEGSKSSWDSEKYLDVLYGDKWEKKYEVKLLDTTTGQTLDITIPSINNGTIFEESFSSNLPDNIVLLEFKEEVNPNIVVTKNPKVTPFAVETLFDIGCFSLSLWEFTSNPSFWSGTAVVLDGAAVLLPFVPAVGGLTINAIKSSNKMTTAVKKGIKPYKTLSKELSGTGLHAHHIMPQKFATTFNVNANDMFSIAIDPTSHTAITARFNSFFKNPANTYTSTYVKNNTKYLYQQMYYETGDYYYKFMADFIEVGQYAPRN